MRITDHINKISWSIADKATFLLYGIALVAILSVTNNVEYAIFTLFNSLHNFIFAVGDALGLQAMLQFSADKNETSRINTFAMLNQCIIVIILVGIVVLFRSPLAEIMNEPNIVTVANSLPLLAFFSIIRYFSIRIMYRELMIFKMFIINLVYFGSMSGIIFYCVFNNYFLDCKDIINITYLGSGFAAITGFIITFKHWKFSLRGSIKYKKVVNFSMKYAITALILPLPKTLDVFVVQYFWGTSLLGFYSPAKTIFRFVDDAINTIYSMIYAPTVRYFAKNDTVSLNNLITKSVSLLIVCFGGLTLLCWLGISDFFSYFLPEKFLLAIPFFNVLMLSSLVLPFTVITTTINASGKPEIVAKYILFSFPFWLGSYFVIGNYFKEYELLLALPYFIFVLSLSFFLFRYANRHYNFKVKQIFRAIPDIFNFISNKLF